MLPWKYAAAELLRKYYVGVDDSCGSCDSCERISAVTGTLKIESASATVHLIEQSMLITMSIIMLPWKYIYEKLLMKQDKIPVTDQNPKVWSIIW